MNSTREPLKSSRKGKGNLLLKGCSVLTFYVTKFEVILLPLHVRNILGEAKASELIFLFVFIGIAFMESPGTHT